ncbi:MAG TPA: DUF4446 family protein [Candidatus Limnocylindria bacterium]|jgi:hypothetical protein
MIPAVPARSGSLALPDLTPWLVLLSIAVVVLAVAVVALYRRMAISVAGYRRLTAAGADTSLADTLDRHLDRVEAVDQRLGELDAQYRSLEARSRGSLQHLGIVRFNPFPDTGSDQSFAIALLNDRHNGVVISSLHARSGTRVFAKPVEAGRTTHALSDEEAAALRIAAEGAPPLSG